MTARTDRIDELFRQEIGKILAREVADPRIGFATITDVETTADLRHARVWVSVIGQKDQREETVRVLEHAMPFVRHELGTRLRLKRIPEFHVRLDDSAERGTRVLHLLSELESGDLPEGRPEGESLPTPVPRLPHEGDAPEAHVPDDAIERPPRVVIDHHVSSEASGAADWIDPAAAATCEMAALLAVRLGIPLQAADGRLAAILTAGIVMDTATFAHPSTTARTLAVAAALVEAGAPLSEISRRLYRSKPEAQLRLFGRVLERLESVDGGLVVWSRLLEEDLKVTGSKPSDSEGIIDLIAQAEDAEVAILFKEAEGSTRLSVRTRPGGVDATVLTGLFGGGGHARAAGATIDRPVEEARPAVLEEARRLASAVRR